MLHGVPRATFDLDILIDPAPENARRLLAALLNAGMGTAAMVTPGDLQAHEVTVFNDRVRVDVQTSTPGIDFASAWRRRESMPYGGQALPVLSRQDLISSKRAAGRAIDLEDVRMLELGPGCAG